MNKENCIQEQEKVGIELDGGISLDNPLLHTGQPTTA